MVIFHSYVSSPEDIHWRIFSVPFLLLTSSAQPPCPFFFLRLFEIPEKASWDLRVPWLKWLTNDPWFIMNIGNIGPKMVAACLVLPNL
jgi:hypothetical protein